MKNWHEMTAAERKAESDALFAAMSAPGWKPPEPFRPSKATRGPGALQADARPKYAEWAEDRRPKS